MKKAKLMLSALGIVALLGTAFAFKAHTFQNHVLFLGAISQPGGATACTDETQGVQIASGTANFRASTTSLSSGCPEAFVQNVDN